MKGEYQAHIDAISRAICAETCAYKGEPPCWRLVETGERVMFPPPTCDEPGCVALARAAYLVVALAEAALSPAEGHPTR